MRERYHFGRILREGMRGIDNALGALYTVIDHMIDHFANRLAHDPILQDR